MIKDAKWQERPSRLGVTENTVCLYDQSIIYLGRFKYRAAVWILESVTSRAVFWGALASGGPTACRKKERDLAFVCVG